MYEAGSFVFLDIPKGTVYFDLIYVLATMRGWTGDEK